MEYMEGKWNKHESIGNIHTGQESNPTTIQTLAPKQMKRGVSFNPHGTVKATWQSQTNTSQWMCCVCSDVVQWHANPNKHMQNTGKRSLLIKTVA